MSGTSRSRSSGRSDSSPTTRRSHLTVPERIPSAPAGRRGGSSYHSTQAGATSGYVSPYPPLSALAEDRTISSTDGMPAYAQRRSQASSSASTSTSSAESNTSSSVAVDVAMITQVQKEGLVNALNEHRINTIGELRRVERIFAQLATPDLTQPMTAAWVYYVNSNTLLVELRRLTSNYPFSSECLDEAKRRVHQDPASNRSWNYCWLVLMKMHTDDLISTFARDQASRAEMWGGQRPPAESVVRLAAAFTQEWNTALAQLLRYWEVPPTR